jgi:putative hydrolase
VDEPPLRASYRRLTSENGRPRGVDERKVSRNREVVGVSERYDGGPVAALRRIAFLLERGREDTYKVKAYRNAAAAILPMPPADVAAAVEDGTLTSLPGVGASTAKVIAAAVHGEVPERLAALEQEHGGPLVPNGTALRAALRGDLHSHSDWSDGGSPIEEMAFTAIELGHEYLVLTDHSPRLTVARGLSPERLTRQLGVVEAVNEHLSSVGGGRFTLLKGIEVDILDDGSLDQEDDLLARLDVRVASVHSKLKMDAKDMTKRMIGAIRNPRTNVLGHCTGRLVTGNRGTRPGSQFDAKAVFEACAEHGVAVEINAHPWRLDLDWRWHQKALDYGCIFSINPDAHSIRELDHMHWGVEMARKGGVPPDRVLNAMPLAKLLRHLQRRRQTASRAA